MKVRLILALLFSAIPASAQRLYSPPSSCGKERWPVKTLADQGAARARTSDVKVTTVSALVRIPPPTRSALLSATSQRFPEEFIKYQVSASIVGYKREADSDFHIVIAGKENPAATMIAEMPMGSCGPATLASAFDILRAHFIGLFSPPTAQYRKLAEPVPVTVVGFGFFDFLHGQTGVAVNGFELHPVISLEKESP